MKQIRVMLAFTLCALLLTAHSVHATFMLGAEQAERYLPLLHTKRVGLVVNQTSVVNDQHLVDFLLAKHINVQVMFAPEHGVRGDKGAGEHVANDRDSQTGIFIQSVYGAQKTPPDEVMRELDVIVFDIQDVGTRFYTYISTMHYMMQAAQKHQVAFVVLDRPNPNGQFVDGPILDPRLRSFVGMHEIPLLHGLTVGELALMIQGENWFEDAKQLDLAVIPMQGYRKSMAYQLPIAPSPNLPNQQAIQLYPSLCLFEATAVSIGRGTDFPFQVIGHDKVHLGRFRFTPESRPYAAPQPKLMGEALFGEDLRTSGIQGFELSPLLQAYKAFKQAEQTFFTAPEFFDKLAGTRQLRDDIERGLTEAEIVQKWQPALEEYKQARRAYLLYPN